MEKTDINERKSDRKIQTTGIVFLIILAGVSYSISDLYGGMIEIKTEIMELRNIFEQQSNYDLNYNTYYLYSCRHRTSGDQTTFGKNGKENKRTTARGIWSDYGDLDWILHLF